MIRKTLAMFARALITVFGAVFIASMLVAPAAAGLITLETDLDDALFTDYGSFTLFRTDSATGGKRPGANFVVSPTSSQQIFVKFLNNESLLAVDLPTYDYHERVSFGMDIDISTEDRVYQLKIALADQSGTPISVFSQTLDATVGAYVGNAGFGFPFAAYGDPTLIPAGGSLEFSGFLIDLSSANDTFNLIDPRIRVGLRSESLSRISNVPEPTTLALMGLGLAGISWKRRKAA